MAGAVKLATALEASITHRIGAWTALVWTSTILVIALVVLTIDTAKGEDSGFRIADDRGGIIDLYIARYAMFRQAGRRVVIDGLCASSCTLVLGLMPDEAVCTTPRGIMAFHSASVLTTGEYSREGTRRMWDIYPAHVHVLLRDLGWNGEAHPELLHIHASVFYPRCDEGKYAVAKLSP